MLIKAVLIVFAYMELDYTHLVHSRGFVTANACEYVHQISGLLKMKPHEIERFNFSVGENPLE